jgi:hypothetical protein
MKIKLRTTTELLTTKETAALLGVQPPRVLVMARDAVLEPVLTAGRTFLFDAADVRRVAAWREAHPTAVKPTSGRWPRGHRRGDVAPEDRGTEPANEGTERAENTPATDSGVSVAAPGVQLVAAGSDKEPVSAKRDRFGSRLGSKQAAVNAVLTETPKKMKEIMQEAGVDATYYNHLGKLAMQGLVVRTKEGFALPPDRGRPQQST